MPCGKRKVGCVLRSKVPYGETEVNVEALPFLWINGYRRIGHVNLDLRGDDMGDGFAIDDTGTRHDLRGVALQWGDDSDTEGLGFVSGMVLRCGIHSLNPLKPVTPHTYNATSLAGGVSHATVLNLNRQGVDLQPLQSTLFPHTYGAPDVNRVYVVVNG